MYSRKKYFRRKAKIANFHFCTGTMQFQLLPVIEVCTFFIGPNSKQGEMGHENHRYPSDTCYHSYGYTFFLVRRAVALGTPDTIVTNFAVLGIIGRAVRFIGACEVMGIGFWCYSGDAGVCNAAYLQMTAATQWIHEPRQSLFRWQTDDVIEEGPFRQTNNIIQVPEGPGLGVTLSPKALKRCHDRFVNEGPINHFYDPGCPDRLRRLPLD
jgi:hypothetical protein